MTEEHVPSKTSLLALLKKTYGTGRGHCVFYRHCYGNHLGNHTRTHARTHTHTHTHKSGIQIFYCVENMMQAT